MSWDMHSFCEKCGAHRRRMPFGRDDSHFDYGPCRKCGEYGARRVIARERWTWRPWFLRREEKS